MNNHPDDLDFDSRQGRITGTQENVPTADIEERVDCLMSEEINPNTKIRRCFGTVITQLQCPHYQQIHRVDYCFERVE